MAVDRLLNAYDFVAFVTVRQYAVNAEDYKASFAEGLQLLAMFPT